MLPEALRQHPRPWSLRPLASGRVDVLDDAGEVICLSVSLGVGMALLSLPALDQVARRCRDFLDSFSFPARGPGRNTNWAAATS